MINYAFAQTYTQAEIQAFSFLQAINNAIVYPLITLLTAVALLVFLWGGFEYVYNAGNEQGREAGRRHLIWGVIGMLVIVSAWSILTVAAGSFPGLQTQLDDSSGQGLNSLTTSPRPTPRPSTVSPPATNANPVTSPPGTNTTSLATMLTNGGLPSGSVSQTVTTIDGYIQAGNTQQAVSLLDAYVNGGTLTQSARDQIVSTYLSN